MENIALLSKKRRIAGWICTGFLALIFIPSAINKFIAAANPASEGYQKMIHYGLEGKVTLTGLGELVTILTFIYPRTAAVALLFFSAHMGAIIATHMEHGENFIFQMVLTVFIWFTQWLRNPDLFKPFATGTKA